MRYLILCSVMIVIFISIGFSFAHEKVVVVPLNVSSSGVEVVTSVGRVWMDRNLGALRVAGSKSDSLAYGWFYQWGRLADGHESRTSPTTFLPSATDAPGHGDFITRGTTPYDWLISQNAGLWQSVEGTNNPCPSGFRLPTESEWETERLSWSSDNSSGAFSSPLKLVVAGFRDKEDGAIYDVGLRAHYWSKTTYGVGSRSMYFDSSGSDSMEFKQRAFGMSVRCIKD